VDTQDLTHLSGSDNTPGLQQKLYYTTLENIVEMPKTVIDDSASPTGSFADLVTIMDDIVVIKPLSFIYVTLEEGELKHVGQGETDSMSFKNSLEFAHPGSKGEVLGFAQWAKNNNMIFFPAEVDGQLRILGNRAYPAKLESAPGSTDKKAAGAKKSTFVFQSSRKGPAPIFKGNVMVQGANGGPNVKQELDLELV
jgi:hypothetical protein